MAVQDIYEKQKADIRQKAVSTGQQQDEALKRRFAAMGGGPGSGVMEKLQLQQQSDLNNNTNSAINDVNAKQSERDYSANEAQKQRDFVAGESKLGREQQGSQFEKTLGFQNRQFDFNKTAKLRELDQAARQMDISREIALINADAQKVAANKSGGLFGGGGFLGLGF